MLHKIFVAAIGLLAFTLSNAQTASVINQADSTVTNPEEAKKEPTLTVLESTDIVNEAKEESIAQLN